jgi:hypothetical protein
MISRRSAIRIALAALPAAWLLGPPVARADQAFQRFFPFLVDLDGWQGQKPDGMSMEMNDSRMITATREYERGPARLQAQVIVGAPAEQALAAFSAVVNIETSDERISSSTIDGMQVTRTFTKKDKSGTILVALGKRGLFSLTFEGIADDDALKLAKKFDWKAIQAAALAK